MNEIKRIKVSMGFDSRGETLEYLVNLALDNMDKPIDDFGEHKDHDCSMTITEEDFANTKQYRAKFYLDKKRHFFLHAICHGVSVHNAEPTASGAVTKAAKKPPKGGVPA